MTVTDSPDSPAGVFDLSGRTAIVTGASSGLGRRFARVLDSAGANVVLAARRLERLEDLSSEMRSAVPVRADVTVPGDRERLLEVAVDHFGAIDVLVNNAGIARSAPALEESDEAFGHVLDVNLRAPFGLARDVARIMIEGNRSGSIVNIVSILGLVGLGVIPQASYAASKGAVVNLTRELAAQWARKGIRVNAIAPGWIPTEMNERMMANEEGREWVASRTPMGRVGRPEELDGALLLLASDASSYMTGQVVAVDGGWTSI